MEGTQFLVQWDEHPSHLATRLGYLLEHQSLVDVTLMCNTHTLKVHRAVLAACSPYFERQLGNHPLIVLKDMQFSVLKSLVEFMYCGETSVSEENLTPLLEAAKFFEVKGLSSMTRETVCAPSSTSNGSATKPFNGIPFPTTSGYNRGSGRGRGRGRGRPPLNPTTSKIGSPTESAQILLSLSGNSQGQTPQIYTTSKNVKIDPSNILSPSDRGKAASGGVGGGLIEPRRRGRKRGSFVASPGLRDRLSRDSEGQFTFETVKRELSDDGDSPLLSSLLTKAEHGKQTDKYNQQLNVPILIDNGDGKLLSFSEDMLKTVVDSDGNIQLQVSESSTSRAKKPLRPFVAKEIRAVKSDDEDDSLSSGIRIKKEVNEVTIKEEVIENLKNGEAELEPDAVVLFEVTGDKKVEKFVLSAKEVSMLKQLNEQLAKQKKELSEITKNNVSTEAVEGTNTKIAELKLKIGKTKSVLSQFVNLKEKLKTIALNGAQEVIEKRAVPEMLHLEFVDRNGEKIGGYDLRGTVEDKRSIQKDTLSKDGDFLGLFDMVCDSEQNNPMLSQNTIKKVDKGEEEMLSNDAESKEMSYQLVSLDDQSENISYDQIEGLMTDSSGNIVIEEKTSDMKYIIDNEGNIMNSDDNYVVYQEGGIVVYDNPEGILPDVSEGENSNNYIVPDGEPTEYVVEYNDKSDFNDEIKQINERGEYIVYNDSGKENYEDDSVNTYETSATDHNFDSTQEEQVFTRGRDRMMSDSTFERSLGGECSKESESGDFVIYGDEGEVETEVSEAGGSGRQEGVSLKATLERFGRLASEGEEVVIGSDCTDHHDSEVIASSSSLNGDLHLDDGAPPVKKRKVDLHHSSHAL